MVPMMGGTVTSSIITGQLISRYGRYRMFPIAGTAIASVGLLLLSGLRANSSTIEQLLYLLVLGLGLGLVNQVLIVAVQNSAPYKDIGVATSGVTMFRLIGGSIGTAVLGTIFATRVASSMAAAAGGDQHLFAAAPVTLTAESLSAMPPAIQQVHWRVHQRARSDLARRRVRRGLRVRLLLVHSRGAASRISRGGRLKPRQWRR